MTLPTAVRIALTAAALCTAAHAADARPRRVVILDFDGPRGFADVGRSTVVDLLGEQYDVVATRRWEEARAKAQQKSAGPATWQKAAKQAGVDAVIEGWVHDEGRHTMLTVQVREAATGQDVDTVSVRLGTRGLSDDNRSKLQTELDGVLEYIEGGPEPLASKLEVIETRRMLGAKAPRGAARPDDDAEDDAGPRRTKRVAVEELDDRDTEDLVSLFGATSDEGKIADPQAAHVPVPTPRFQIAGGGYYGSRSLTFEAENQTGPQAYAGVPSQGLELRAAVYPFPVKPLDGALSGLGFSFGISQSAGSLVTFDDLETVSEYTIDQSAYKAGVHYRHQLAELVAIDGEVSYGRSSYLIADAPVEFEVPDVQYSYLGAGAHLDLTIARRASVGFGARYMYLLDVGDISSVDWYGPGRASGFGLDGDFVVPLPSNLFVRGALSYERYKISYDGVGQITEDEGVSASSDATVNGSLNVGIQF